MDSMNIGTQGKFSQGQVQPRQNGAKRLLNGNGDVLNTLFWWRKQGRS